MTELTAEEERLMNLIYDASHLYHSTAERLARGIIKAGYRQVSGKAPVLTDAKIARANTCWGCEYRESGKPDYINICLLDENKPCVRDNVITPE